MKSTINKKKMKQRKRLHNYMITRSKTKHEHHHHHHHHHHRRSLVDLPSEIVLEIVSRLPLKSILRCKHVSKQLNHLITTNPSSSSKSLTVMLYNKEILPPINLIEFDRSTSSLVSQNTLPAPGKIYKKPYCEVYGTCDGLILVTQFEKGIYYNLYFGNPILGQFIQLPDPVPHFMDIFPSYGLGYCQLTSRYKVLRITTKIVGPKDYRNMDQMTVPPTEYRNKAEVFTIGVDRDWRSVEDANVPYNMVSGIYGPPIVYTHKMICLDSRLHWHVHRVRLPFCNLEPKWGGINYICAFDLMEEKASAIKLPLDDAACDCSEFCTCYIELGVLLGKLCVCKCNYKQLNVWTMVEYGNASSWTKQFVLKTSVLPACVVEYKLRVRTVLDEGVMVLSNLRRYVFYDLIRKKTLMVLPLTEYCGPMLFYPSFVSLRNICCPP